MTDTAQNAPWTPSQWFQLCTSSVELLGVHGEVGGDTTWLRMLPSLLRKGKVECLTPASWPAWHTPAGRCRLAASAGPPPWPAGSLQTSNLWWAPPALWGERGRDGRSADKSYSLELVFIRNGNLLSHDTPHVDGKKRGVPFLLLRGGVDRKELQTAKAASIVMHWLEVMIKEQARLFAQWGAATGAQTYLNHKLIVELAERQPQDFKPGHKRTVKHSTLFFFWVFDSNKSAKLWPVLTLQGPATSMWLYPVKVNWHQ